MEAILGDEVAWYFIMPSLKLFCLSLFDAAKWNGMCITQEYIVNILVTFPLLFSYFGCLEGCGAELHREIRESYYQLLHFLVNAVKDFSNLSDRCGLH